VLGQHGRSDLTGLDCTQHRQNNSMPERALLLAKAAAGLRAASGFVAHPARQRQLERDGCINGGIYVSQPGAAKG
jgi:hypothetical protein